MPVQDGATLLSDDEVSQFITDGFLLLRTDLDAQFHARMERRLREVSEHESWHGNNIVARIPALHDVVRCPRVHGALVSLLGEDYLFHPHRAVHRSTPIEDASLRLDDAADAPPMGEGSTAGSAWHQDAQSPLARARHHVPRFLIGFYFPHDTPHRMGPTRLQAGSYLWPHPAQVPSGVVVPKCVPAGTFMLVHFDMVHAGFSNRTDTTRFMVKFVFSRMSNPTAPAWRTDRSHWITPASQTEIRPTRAWAYSWRWLRGERPVGDGTGSLEELRASRFDRAIDAIYRRYEPAALAKVLRAQADKGLHERVLAPPHKGVQYIRDDTRGYPRRWNERAIVMESSAYALAAQGEAALPALLELARVCDPWLDVNVAFALGEIGCFDEAVAAQLQAYLRSAHQQVVRQAVDAVAFSAGDASGLLDDFEALMTQERATWRRREVERGWCALDQIRLNIMFACVALVGTPTDRNRLEALLRMGLDDVGYAAQVAVEGLRRLATPSALDAALRYTSERSWDDTLLGMAKAY